MRTDALDTKARLAPPPETGPSPPRPRAAGVVPVVVGGLVLGTSAAVAAVSWWLVPPYLALMAFLLLEPAGRRVSATNPAGPRSATSEAPASGAAPDPAESAGPGETPVPAESAPAPRARRTGKGRGSRKAKPTIEPAPATWVQVAPGKFVRVEPGTSPAGPGPYHPLPPGAPGPSPAEAMPELEDAPTEPALEPPHLDPEPAEGLAPEGPRDPVPDVAGDLPDDGEPARPAVSGRDDGPDPGFCPDPGAPSVEAAPADPDPIREPESRAIDLPDLAAGTQPEAPAGDTVEAREEGGAGEVEASAPGESPGLGDAPESASTAEDDAGAEGLAPDAEAALSLAAEAGLPGGPDVADGAEVRAGDPPRGMVPDAPGAPSTVAALAAWFRGGVPPARRDVRPARAPRRPNGLRLRSKRGDGRPHRLARAFPPRSPPRRAATCA